MNSASECPFRPHPTRAGDASNSSPSAGVLPSSVGLQSFRVPGRRTRRLPRACEFVDGRGQAQGTCRTSSAAVYWQTWESRSAAGWGCTSGRGSGITSDLPTTRSAPCAA